jgi:hypothetical protein
MAGPRRQAPVQVPSQQHEKWLSTLSAQHGVLDISQLHGFGVTWAAIRAQILAGRWQAVLPRVYATFSGPLPREARIAAALLYAGPAALLSHRTAAELWGMYPESPGPVHVTVPYQCSAISQPPLVVVHRSRAFGNIGRQPTSVDQPGRYRARRGGVRTLAAGGPTSPGRAHDWSEGRGRAGPPAIDRAPAAQVQAAARASRCPGAGRCGVDARGALRGGCGGRARPPRRAPAGAIPGRRSDAVRGRRVRRPGRPAHRSTRWSPPSRARCGAAGSSEGQRGRAVRPVPPGVRLDRSEPPALRRCHGGRQRSSPPRLARPAPPLPKMPWSAPVSGIGRYDDQYHSRG